MKIIVNILNKLDDFFELKSDNEKWMMIGMITIIIGYMSYSLFYPYAENEYKQAEHKNVALKKSIYSNKEYIQSITVNNDRDYYVKERDKEILVLEKRIDTTNDNIDYIEDSFRELLPLLFNKESWSKFLNSITKQAKKQVVKINYIENNYVNNNGNFGHVLQIEVGCSGKYKNIVKFINQLEKSVLVTDIYGSHMYLDQNDTVISADINISVWGVNQ